MFFKRSNAGFIEIAISIMIKENGDASHVDSHTLKKL
jgi:hypothetical protein